MPGRIIFGDNTDYDDYDADTDRNYEYLESLVPTKSSLVFVGLATTLLWCIFLGSLIYVLVTGNRIYDDKGQDSTVFFLAAFGVVASVFSAILVHTGLKYRDTHGTTSLLEDPDMAESFSNMPRWVDSDAPGQTYSVFYVIGPAIAVLACLGVFIAMVFKILALASQDWHQLPEDQNPGYAILLVISLCLTFFFGYMLKRHTDKYLYFRRFSQEPMIHGVYYASANGN